MNCAFRGSSTSAQHLLATIRHTAGQWIETGATNLDRLLASNSVVISCFARVGRAFTIILYPPSAPFMGRIVVSQQTFS